MNFAHATLARLKHAICLALLLPAAIAHATDVFDPATGQVRLDTVLLGATRYQAVVVVPGRAGGLWKRHAQNCRNLL